MKKETKEFARLFGIALIVMLVVPLTYRVCIFFWPPNEKPRQTLTEFVEKAKSERCTKLLTKPIVKWTDAESKSEPEIHAWLKEQGNDPAVLMLIIQDDPSALRICGAVINTNYLYVL